MCPRGIPPKEHRGPQPRTAGRTVSKVLQHYGVEAAFPFGPPSGWLSLLTASTPRSVMIVECMSKFACGQSGDTGSEPQRAKIKSRFQLLYVRPSRFIPTSRNKLPELHAISPYLRTAASVSARHSKVGLCLPFKRHIPIPFPRFALVRRECLAPNRNIWVRFIPVICHDDGFSGKNILCVKSPDVGVE